MKGLVKIILLFAIPIILSACIFDDEEEKWDAAKVCPETGTNSYGMPNRGTFTDERDGRVYKYTTIGKQVWMAENLSFNIPFPHSLCYGMEYCYPQKRFLTDTATICNRDTAKIADIAQRMQSSCTDSDCIAEEFCKKFGRYYALMENGVSLGLLNRDVVDSVCPSGWHVPTKSEWEILLGNVENKPERLLASNLDYYELSEGSKPMGSITDDCGMELYSMGLLSKDAHSERLFDEFLYWTQTQKDLTAAYVVYGNYFRVSFIPDYKLIPIRCLKD